MQLFVALCLEWRRCRARNERNSVACLGRSSRFEKLWWHRVAPLKRRIEWWGVTLHWSFGSTPSSDETCPPYAGRQPGGLKFTYISAAICSSRPFALCFCVHSCGHEDIRRMASSHRDLRANTVELFAIAVSRRFAPSNVWPQQAPSKIAPETCGSRRPLCGSLHSRISPQFRLAAPPPRVFFTCVANHVTVSDVLNSPLQTATSHTAAKITTCDRETGILPHRSCVTMLCVNFFYNQSSPDAFGIMPSMRVTIMTSWSHPSASRNHGLTSHCVFDIFASSQCPPTLSRSLLILVILLQLDSCVSYTALTQRRSSLSRNCCFSLCVCFILCN